MKLVHKVSLVWGHLVLFLGQFSRTVQ